MYVSLPWLTVKLEKPYASCQMNIQKVKFARDVSSAILKGMVECGLKITIPSFYIPIDRRSISRQLNICNNCFSDQ